MIINMKTKEKKSFGRKMDKVQYIIIILGVIYIISRIIPVL